MAFFRLFVLEFQLFMWRLSLFRLFAWRYFVFSHGVISSFRLFAWRLFVFSFLFFFFFFFFLFFCCFFFCCFVVVVFFLLFFFVFFFCFFFCVALFRGQKTKWNKPATIVLCRFVNWRPIYNSKKVSEHTWLNCLLATRQNDNHSPGPWPWQLVPSFHQKRELGNSVPGTFNRRDKRVWKWFQSLMIWGKATLINISISNVGVRKHI